jgi:hypothetical protein
MEHRKHLCYTLQIIFRMKIGCIEGAQEGWEYEECYEESSCCRKIIRHTKKGSVKKIMETRRENIVRIQQCNGEVPEMNNNENKNWKERLL